MEGRNRNRNRQFRFRNSSIKEGMHNKTNPM